MSYMYMLSSKLICPGHSYILNSSIVPGTWEVLNSCIVSGMRGDNLLNESETLERDYYDEVLAPL